MESEDFTIFLEDLLTFLKELEISISKMREQIIKLMGAENDRKRH